MTFRHAVSISKKLYPVSGRSRISSMSGPIGVEKFAARPVYPFVLMCTKIIALSLQKIGR